MESKLEREHEMDKKKLYDRHEKCTFDSAMAHGIVQNESPPTPIGIKTKLKSSKIETQLATTVIHSTEWILFLYVPLLYLHKSNHIEIQIAQFTFVHFMFHFSIARVIHILPNE